jgi:L-iditol 2-dehydrogenase/threonine 3-dehydrogenase
MRIFGENGFDVAFECVGIEATMTEVIETIQKGGTIVVVGVFAEEPRINLGFVQDRELNLIGTLMYQYRDYEKAVEFIDTGKVKTEPLYSKHFPFSSYADAYDFIDAQRDKSMKVFIDL